MSALHIPDGGSRRLREVPASPDVDGCDARSPWQRRSDENANGIVREFLSMGIDLTPFTDQDLRRIEFAVNSPPCTSVGFATLHEVLDPIAGAALPA